jgi:hypothetical protein
VADRKRSWTLGERIAALLFLVAVIAFFVESLWLAAKISRSTRSFPSSAPVPSSRAIWAFFMIPYLVLAFAISMIWGLNSSSTPAVATCWILVGLAALLIGASTITGVRQRVGIWAHDWLRARGDQIVTVRILRQAGRFV